jgi:primosomal protein N' (replication factor Y)
VLYAATQSCVEHRTPLILAGLKIQEDEYYQNTFTAQDNCTLFTHLQRVYSLNTPDQFIRSTLELPVIVSVALPTPLRKTFDYTLKRNMSNHLNDLIGTRAQVSFANQTLIGIITKVGHTSQFDLTKLKPITELLDEKPILSAELIKLCERAANYYCHPLGEVMAAAIPVALRQGASAVLPPLKTWHAIADKAQSLNRAAKQLAIHQRLSQRQQWSAQELQSVGITNADLKPLLKKQVVIEKQQPLKLNRAEPLIIQIPHQMSSEQITAVKSVSLTSYNTHLLYGITGSGKTEVYLQLISKVLIQQQQVLILVPEIGLTPQTIQRFQSRFNRTVVAIHSNLNNKERCSAWLMAANGTADIIIGTRSAIFTPLKSPGLIIIDEEHDSSLKQQDGFRYNARDLAVMRAQKLNIPLILGSATPSLESFNNVQQQRYVLSRLTQRAGSASMPHMSTIDLCNQPLQDGFSQSLINAIDSEIKQGNQVLVFLNRRGYAPALLCHHCGWLAQCPRCDSRLTVHQDPQHLHCHHCDYQRGIIRNCPTCNSHEIQSIGQGTERCEQTLTNLFPSTPIIRIDRDTTRKKNSLKNMLDDINLGEPRILIGTQMLAKGHHFPNVTLVAVLDADSGLFTADFRAAERFGQLLTQVSGRAGRADKPGRVLIQSHLSSHPYLQALIQNDYSHFIDLLEPERRLSQLPPFSYMALIRSEAKRPENAMSLLNQLRATLNQTYTNKPQVSLLGPIPAPMEKRNDRYRFQLQINAETRQLRHQAVMLALSLLETSAFARRARWSIDIDPQDMN